MKELALEAAELTIHRKALKALTGIRFWAALYVVIFHSRVGASLSASGHSAAGNFFRNGYLAVPLFFVLSGFILAYTYHGQIEQPGSYRRFWEARFARIWPVYAVSLFFSSLPPVNALPRPGIMFATLLMLQAWNPFDVAMAGAWNFVCWTLSAEALFYLVFPWVQVWLEKRSTKLQLGWVGLMLVTCLVFNSASRSLGSPVTGITLHLPLSVLHLSEFFSGVGLGNYFLRWVSLRTSRSTVRLAVGGGICTYVSAIAAVALLCHPTWRGTSLVVIAFSGLVFGLAAEKTMLSQFLSTRTMLLGGGISYSVYLMQMPVKAWGTLLADRFHLGTAVRLPLNAVLLILISLILFKAVEEPARRVLRSFFAAIENRRRVLSLRRQTAAFQEK